MKLFPVFRNYAVLFPLAVALFLPGCASLQRKDPAVSKSKEQYTAFRSQPGWRKKSYRDEKLMAKASEGNTSVEIALREQRGLLLVDKAIAMDFPVATGRSTHPTPKGEYKILEKKKDYASNIYGRIVSGDGSTLVSDADTRDHAVPSGAQFVGAPMPYWLRMTTTGVGMHVGHVPGHRPASHGCIRLKRETATELFSLLPVGTPVTVASFAPSLGGPVGVDSVVIGEFAEKPDRPRRARQSVPAASPSPTPIATDGSAATAPDQVATPTQTAAPSATPIAEVPPVPAATPALIPAPLPESASAPAVAPSIPAPATPALSPVPATP